MRAFGRSLEDFLPLSEAEQRLVEDCRRGELTELGEAVPDAMTDGIRIRAGLVRFLALGGDDDNPVHERGIRLFGAWIDGDLDLRDCDLKVPLRLEVCRLGEVKLRQARLPMLSLCGSRVDGELGAERADIRGDVFLNQGFRARGEVRLLGASIGGDLVCRGGRFENPGGVALGADGAKIGGSVYLDHGFLARGEVRLLGASINGSLECSGGLFESPGGNALCADRAEIRGGVFLNQKFNALGEVRLLGASIGGNLDCRGGRFENTDGDALSADAAKIGGDVVLDRGFHASGSVRLPGASIGSTLWCSGGRFENPKGKAFLCQAAQVRGALVWRNIAGVQGRLNLNALRAANLVDDAASWEKADGGLILDGFQYERLTGDASSDAAMRIAWLKRQVPEHLGENFQPQPWEQCAKVLREMGHADAARAVLIEKETLERAAGRHGGRWSLRRALHWFYGESIGYGYRPGPLVAATALVYALSVILFWLAANPSRQWWSAPAYLIQPTAQAAELPSPSSSAPAYDTFFAPAHALEVMMPITNLRRPPEWKLRLQDERGEWLTGARVLMGWTWFLTLYGWVAGILLVLWVGKLIKRD